MQDGVISWKCHNNNNNGYNHSSKNTPTCRINVCDKNKIRHDFSIRNLIYYLRNVQIFSPSVEIRFGTHIHGTYNIFPILSTSWKWFHSINLCFFHLFHKLFACLMTMTNIDDLVKMFSLTIFNDSIGNNFNTNPFLFLFFSFIFGSIWILNTYPASREICERCLPFTQEFFLWMFVVYNTVF